MSLDDERPSYMSTMLRAQLMHGKLQLYQGKRLQHWTPRALSASFWMLMWMLQGC
jgi:hypothetical protein